jgi:hypothetical protein
MLSRRYFVSGVAASVLGHGRVSRASQPQNSPFCAKSPPADTFSAPQSSLCPTLGFTSITDLSVLGPPVRIGQPTPVIALIHNLSPAGYLSQVGEVKFRWCPFGYAGDLCALPLLTLAPPTQNPTLAYDPNTGANTIEPGSYLPAQISWVPGPADVGNQLVGFILCQAIAVADGPCPEFVPPDCSSAPYNLRSWRITVRPA